MRREAAFEKRRTPRQQTIVVKTVPAPVGGWNARDPLADMGALDAVMLDNWFPRIADCAIRGGCADHVTGFASRPASLMTYMPPTGSNKMFASTNLGVFDATSPGAVGASVAACTNGYWNWTNMGVSGGNYLMMFNGTDNPLYFDGTTWISITGASVPAITGLTTSTIISGFVFKRRLYLIQGAKLSFWYLPADAVGGAAAEFLLGPLCQRGGFLMEMGSWSFDGGAGPDDFAVFMTSEGEVVLFKGSNPADSTNWLLVGTYFIGRPIGRKSLYKYGGDLVAITEFGAFPLSKLLLAATVDYRSALTNKIEGAFNASAKSFFSNKGWEAALLPNQSAFIFNIPLSDGGVSAVQYVMNTTTKSWCRFTGWNASAFAVFNGDLYYADATKVAKAWTGRADYGANIVAAAETSFNNFGSTSQEKDWKMVRPLFLVDGTLSFSLGLAIDFQQNTTLAISSFTPVAGAIWDTAVWDAAFWASGLEVKTAWGSPAARPGYWAAGLLQVATNQLEVHWISMDYTYEVGGVL